ncbi:hypothetical protein J6590_020569 [Homalodisca vitripennis]|nr:hypothetical protein J6590_020569 [Homalodisca vitripennis]
MILKHRCVLDGAKEWIDRSSLLRSGRSSLSVKGFASLAMRECCSLNALNGEAGTELAFSSSKMTRLRYSPIFLIMESGQEAAVIPNLTHPEYLSGIKHKGLFRTKCNERSLNMG